MKSIVTISAILILSPIYFHVEAQSLNEYFTVADSLYRSKNYKESLELLIKAEANGYNTPSLYHRIGDTYSLLNNPQTGLIFLNKALEMNPNDSLRRAISFDLADAKYLAGDYDGAIDGFKAVLGYEPDRYNALINLLAIYTDAKRFPDAKIVISELLKSYEQDHSVILNIGYLYLNQGLIDSSIYYFEKAYQIDPNEPLTLNNLGNAYYKQGKFNEALSFVNRSIKIWSENPYAYRNRGLIYTALKMKKEACVDYEKAIGLGYLNVYGEDILEFQKETCK